MLHFLYPDNYVTSVFCFLYLGHSTESCNANSVATEYIQTIFPILRGPHKAGVYFFFSDVIYLLLKSTLSIPSIFFKYKLANYLFMKLSNFFKMHPNFKVNIMHTHG